MRSPTVILGLLFSIFSTSQSASAESVFGFSKDAGAAQLEREKRYESQLNADNLRAWMQRMTVRPHHVGSPQAKANAEFIAGLFREWGYETEIETFHVLFPTPKTRELEMLGPKPWKASLTERVVEEDPAAAALKAEGLPPYNAYSADGEAVGELVYVRYGVPEDYEELERRGIDVRGKIVIARYGGSWRGIKPKVAAEKGAIGCLIFNDPEDDGFAQGDPYPEGAFKHPSAVQRGSIVDLPKRPGDPLTPGRGATERARRVRPGEAETIMRIPTLPISYEDAMPLLEAMGGPVAPEAWRGGMPVTYRLGGDGSVRVRLKTAFNWDLTPAYNVIAKLRGSEYPDQWIIRGNHHDAWVIGARDPMSGMVALLEQARATAELAKTGWRPKRTLVFCAWDGEEPGLLGSTEWAEHHARELREKAVAYINTDGNSRGFLGIGGSHALERLANEVAQAVTDPQTGVSVAERLRAARLVRGTAEQKKLAKAGANFHLSALGSGSDYTPFLQHLGIATLNAGFGGEGEGGEYHTSFDTFSHYSRFIDPKFEYGVALANVCGRLTLRLADAEALPFDFSGTARAIGEYTDQVVKLADTMREETEELNTLIEAGRFTQAADPTKTYVPPAKKGPVPHINFAPLLNAIESLKASAETYKKTAETLISGNAAPSKSDMERFNALVYRTERAFTLEDGLPRRPWYRHQIYAPGYYTGYGVKTLPGVREAIEEREWADVEGQVARAAKTINDFANEIERAVENTK